MFYGVSHEVCHRRHEECRLAAAFAEVRETSASMTPTILHVASFFPEYGGNFVASLMQLRKSCQAEGWDLAVVFPEGAKQRPWCANWRQKTGGFTSCLAAHRDCDVHGPLRGLCPKHASLIHTHFVQYDLAAWMAARLAAKGGGKVPVVWHVHSELNVPPTAFRRLTNFIKYRMIARSAWLIPVGESAARAAIAAGCPAARVHTVENGVDLARATAATRSRSQVLADLGIDEDERLILMFGFEPLRKGVDVALDAMTELVKERPRAVLGIVGREELRAYVHNRVGGQPPAWLRILSPIEHVANLHQAATIFLSASRSEGFPYAVTEAMANRVPVVSSDIPSLAWFHKSTGAMFFPPGDPQAAAARLREVLDWSDTDREQHVRSNEHLVKTEYDVVVWAQRILRQYKNILGEGEDVFE